LFYGYSSLFFSKTVHTLAKTCFFYLASQTQNELAIYFFLPKYLTRLNFNLFYYMSNTESSFADRLQRGRQLQSIIDGFEPDFAPADNDLTPAAFLTFLDHLDALNTAVANAEAGWRESAALRLDTVADIKSRALRSLSRVKSHKGWAQQMPLVKSAADSLRGYKPSRQKTAPKDNGTPAVMTQPKADQSFADIKHLLDKLIAALKKVPGYDTGVPEGLSIAEFTTLSEALNTRNQAVATFEQDLGASRAPRLSGYETLRERKKAIKEAARSQYGSKSAEYAQARAVRV
jgi:hypothetical protein